MSKEAKDILAAFPQLSQSELWLIIEAALLYVRESDDNVETLNPEMVSEINRRRQLLEKGKITTRPAFEALQQIRNRISAAAG